MQPMGSGQRVLMRELAAMFRGGAGACALQHSGPDEATAHAHNVASAFFPARSLPGAFASSLKRAAAPAGAERGGRGAMRPQQAPVSGKVFIQRDYSGGTRCQFQSKFPAELENRIDRQQFEETVRTLNNLYAEAEKLGGQSYLEGCLACLTAYTIFLCMETHYEKVLKKIAKFIQEQNEKIYAPQGLLLTDPIERGLRVIEITIYEDRGMSSGR